MNPLNNNPNHKVTADKAVEAMSGVLEYYRHLRLPSTEKTLYLDIIKCVGRIYLAAQDDSSVALCTISRPHYQQWLEDLDLFIMKWKLEEQGVQSVIKTVEVESKGAPSFTDVGDLDRGLCNIQRAFKPKKKCPSFIRKEGKVQKWEKKVLAVLFVGNPNNAYIDRWRCDELAFGSKLRDHQCRFKT